MNTLQSGTPQLADPWPGVFTADVPGRARRSPRSGRAFSAQRLAQLRARDSGPWGRLVPPARIDSVSLGAMTGGGFTSGAVVSASAGGLNSAGDPFPGVAVAQTISFGFGIDLFAPTFVVDGVVINDPAFVGLPSFPGTFEPVDIQPVWSPPTPLGCVQITAPPFSSVTSSTAACFATEYPGLLDWPSTPCEVVCRDARPIAACTGNHFWATPAEIDAARPFIKPLIAGTESAQNTLPGQRLLTGPLSVDEETALASALALARNNIDLVRWAVCTAVSHARDNRTRDPGSRQPPAPTYTPQEASDFVADALVGAMNIYVLGVFLRPNGTVYPATGSATVRFTPWDGGEGPLIPIQHNFFASGQGIVSAIANPAYVGSDGSAGLCAAMAIASIYIHEIIHLLDPADHSNPISGALDGLACWTVQSMALTAFSYALSQRYPCLRQPKMQSCCQKVLDSYFMFSDGPGGWVADNYDVGSGQCQ